MEKAHEYNDHVRNFALSPTGESSQMNLFSDRDHLQEQCY